MDNHKRNLPIEVVKKKRIKNKYYVEFLEKGLIQYVNPEHIDKAVSRIKGSNRDMALSLIYCLYLTGARPVEILSLKGKDITREKSYLKMQVPAAKNGLPRPIFIQLKNPYAKHILNYAKQLMPEMYIHHSFRGSYIRNVLNKKGVLKTYNEISRPVRYYFLIWFKNILGVEAILPYHLRHNRFSKQSEAGSTPEEMRIMKGAKTYTSITPYIHLSSERGKKMAKTIT